MTDASLALAALLQERDQLRRVVADVAAIERDFAARGRGVPALRVAILGRPGPAAVTAEDGQVLDLIQSLELVAQPGPWCVLRDRVLEMYEVARQDTGAVVADGIRDEATAVLIAATHNALPTLLSS